MEWRSILRCENPGLRASDMGHSRPCRGNSKPRPSPLCRRKRKRIQRISGDHGALSELRVDRHQADAAEQAARRSARK
jgi:hypothetical protein